MRRLLYLFIVALVVTAMAATTASAQLPISCDHFWSTWEPWPSDTIRYPSQEEAQKYFDTQATPQEKAILDTDGDGYACDAWGTGVDKLGIQGGEDGYWGSDGLWYYY